uniref:Uncharacterized protein n=1 Tax=Bactrocera latifrons TaxID=174628 RepID=A0A0K8UHV2_BACLA
MHLLFRKQQMYSNNKHTVETNKNITAKPTAATILIKKKKKYEKYEARQIRNKTHHTPSLSLSSCVYAHRLISSARSRSASAIVCGSGTKRSTGRETSGLGIHLSVIS